MAIVALHSSATGLTALSTKLDVIANNLANANTNGFKASRVNFQDLIYETKAHPGVENANGDQRPAGIQVGLGVQIANTELDQKPGSAITTTNQLDLFIEGDGYFQVALPNDQGGIGYTRTGNFFLNKDSEIVLGNAEGPRMEPPITVPTDVARISVAKDGQVIGFRDEDPVGQNLGQIQLARFVNPKGLKAIGGNIFIETDASGQREEGVPGTGGLGKLLQSFIESSNVDPVTELVELIKTQRAFEMNSQTIQAADEALGVISNLRRF